MYIKQIWFYLITFVLMIVMIILIKNVFMAGGITIVIMMTSYILFSIYFNKKRVRLLEEECKPQSFIEATENQILITGKNKKINSYLCIDKAAGLVVKGEYQEAFDILNTIDQSSLSIKDGSLLVYNVNLIMCLYELGDITHAEEIFEAQVTSFAPLNLRMRQIKKRLDAERNFHLKEYDESKEKFESILKEKLSRRKRLEILFRLAQIDEFYGDTISATKKFKEVADNGGELWVALQARAMNFR